MRVDVQRFGDRALLEYTPSLLVRWFRPAFDRYAVRRGSAWFDDATGERIDLPQLDRPH